MCLELTDMELVTELPGTTSSAGGIQKQSHINVSDPKGLQITLRLVQTAGKTPLEIITFML